MAREPQPRPVNHGPRVCVCACIRYTQPRLMAHRRSTRVPPALDYICLPVQSMGCEKSVAEYSLEGRLGTGNSIEAKEGRSHLEG